jgi:hypothetical protein
MYPSATCIQFCTNKFDSPARSYIGDVNLQLTRRRGPRDKQCRPDAVCTPVAGLATINYVDLCSTNQAINQNSWTRYNLGTADDLVTCRDTPPPLSGISSPANGPSTSHRGQRARVLRVYYEMRK